MNKSTPVTPVNGYISIQCAAGRHHACRPQEWGCQHPAHGPTVALPPSPGFGEHAGGDNGVAEPKGQTEPHASPRGREGVGDAGSKPRANRPAAPSSEHGSAAAS